nr:hypothetical protein CFP56_78365 [Quercus suber]
MSSGRIGREIPGVLRSAVRGQLEGISVAISSGSGGGRVAPEEWDLRKAGAPMILSTWQGQPGGEGLRRAQHPKELWGAKISEVRQHPSIFGADVRVAPERRTDPPRAHHLAVGGLNFSFVPTPLGSQHFLFGPNAVGPVIAW